MLAVEWIVTKGLMKTVVLLGLLLWLGGCTSQEELKIGALAHFNRGNQAFEALDYRRAIDEYNQSIALFDQQPSFHYNLGLCYYHLVLFEPAELAYRRALELNPEMAVAWYNLALVLDKQNRSDEAFMAYDRYQKLSIAQAKTKAKPLEKPQVKQIGQPEKPKGNLPKREEPVGQKLFAP